MSTLGQESYSNENPRIAWEGCSDINDGDHLLLKDQMQGETTGSFISLVPSALSIVHSSANQGLLMFRWTPPHGVGPLTPVSENPEVPESSLPYSDTTTGRRNLLQKNDDIEEEEEVSGAVYGVVCLC